MTHDLNSTQNLRLDSVSRLTDRLIDIDEMREILGYDDNRSVRTWCDKKTIPIFNLGKRMYTLRNFLEVHLENTIQKFAEDNYENSNEIMDAIKNDEVIKINPKVEVRKNKKREAQTMCDASARFLKNKD